MIRLDATTKIVQLIATTTANVIVTGSDKTATAYTGFSQETAATASTQTICAAPAASTIRDIDHITVKNTGAANTVTVQMLNSSGAVTTQMLAVLLATGDMLEYTHGSGWQALDSNGVVKLVSASYARTDIGNTFTGVSNTTSWVMTTPVLGVAAATTLNKVTITAPATSATLTIADGKTLTANSTLTLTGTDSTVMTFPTTSATIARTDAANTFTGVQTMTSPAFTTPVLGTPSSGNLANCTGYPGTSALVTTGALNSGSITSGFGAINIGADALTAGTGTFSGTLSATTGMAVGGATAGTGGIAFPATAVAVADANTLDDYEEGTFSPTVIGFTTAGTATYVRQAGYYTKIGNRVLFSIDVVWNTGTGTGDLGVSGLPFTSSAVTMLKAIEVIGDAISLTAGSYLQGSLLSLNATSLSFIQSATGAANMSSVPYDAAGQLSISGQYFI